MRRAVIAACAFAFILVSFGHALHHVDAARGQSGYAISTLAAADGANDTERQMLPHAGHCHMCSMVVVSEPARALDTLTASAPVATAPSHSSPGAPAFDLRPPIALT